MTTEEFINESNKIHNNKYDYSKTVFEKKYKKLKIICPEHGEFEQIAIQHLKGCGCNKCAKYKPLKYSTEDIIKKFKEVHGDIYDYSKVNYTGIGNNVCIICPEHGEFYQSPHNHLKGNTCPKCAVIRISKLNTMTTEEYINKARQINGNKYDYSKVNYTGCENDVCIICPEHGEFMINAHAHLRKQGCPKCNEYKYETIVRVFLEQNNIKFIHQYYPDFLSKGKGHQSLDFYLPEYNVAIECQGVQHYKPINKFGGYKAFKIQKQLDDKKLKKCNENGIKILYFSTSIYRNENDISNLDNLLYEIKNTA